MPKLKQTFFVHVLIFACIQRHELQIGDIKILFFHERSYVILRGGIVSTAGERLPDTIE